MVDQTIEKGNRTAKTEGRRANTANQGSPGDGPSPFAVPSISMPKGGGAIRGMGEKFAANPVTGTGSMTVPIAVSPGRAGFGPQLSLSYDSGAGNGSFGLGWNLSLPAITRKTDKGLPKYQDAAESDIFILSGAEDLVPLLEPDGKRFEDIDTFPDYKIHRYRPRVEGLFARIERWTHQPTGDVHWRSITKDNVTTLYGQDNRSRLFDPADSNTDHPTRIFSWLISSSYDAQGNAIVYDYKPENDDKADLTQANERNRARSANRHLKSIKYGNRAPNRDADWRPKDPHLLPQEGWMFEVVFDYGEHDPANPKPGDAGQWLCRQDPFSTYRSGFEVRTYRLCQRVLMFHHFEGEAGVGQNCLVRSTDFSYTTNHIASFISSITQSGYKREGAGYLKRSLPPLEFTYSEAVIEDRVRELDAESIANLPSGLDGSNYQWVDLDGDGVAGILTEQANAWFYIRNLSPKTIVIENNVAQTRANFAPLEIVAVQPSFKNISGGGLQFLDLAGDGRPDLVQFDGPAPGFYEHEEDDTWTPHRPFTSLPNIDWHDPNLKFIDLTGDGHADILISEDEVFTWYPSLAEAGFGMGERSRQPFDEERGQRLVFADGTQSIFLADFSGDGLTDLVRIRNGEVCYWPNLGYGHFGAKVTMDNAPWFDSHDLFDQRRIRLADIDGSGVTDILYLGGDGVRLYFNQSGNRWGDARLLNVFPRTDNLSSVTVTDLLGNGTACLVWSSPLPGDVRRPMRYVALMGGQKPHLMISSHNNLGAETRIHYAPSTKFYLQDKYDGNPWITRLPFPVQVVERVETIDHIGRNHFVTRYAYHHGYFDGAEREFRGFGMVEQFDTDEFDKLDPAAANVDAGWQVPPVHTKTWFHTGAFIRGQEISRHLAHEYFGAPRDQAAFESWAKENLLDDTVLPEATLTADETREACRALKGALLRQEVYADDDSAKAGLPYTVTEQNFSIERLQPRAENRHAVFFTHAREAVSYHYERNLDDPRVTHAMTLEVDPYGNVLRSLTIGYGRKTSPLPEQRDRDQQITTLVTYTENRFTNASDDANNYRAPLPAEARAYEMTGFKPENGAPRFSFGELIKNGFEPLISALEIPYEQTADPSKKQKRLIECVRTLYRHEKLTGLLAPGIAGPLAIPGESYKLALTPGLLGSVFKRKRAGLPDEALLPNPAAPLEGRAADQGGYVRMDGNWWIPSGKVFFHPDADITNPGLTAALELDEARQHFFLLRKFADPFDHCTVVKYDTRDLLIIRTQDALFNTVEAVNDYRVLQPNLITDPNRNRTAATFDSLGMVTATAVMGKTAAEGDLLDDLKPDLTEAQIAAFVAQPRQPSANPAESEAAQITRDLLQKATTRIVYDLDRFQRLGQPPFAATIARETHVSHLAAGEQSKLQVSFSYSDGFGREIQKKMQAEPGPLSEGGPTINPRWVGSGWTIFNNKGKPVRQYEPFFDDTHNFKFASVAGVSPVLFYDPVERVVATLHPNKTYEKVVFDSWQQKTYDVNDTVAPSDSETGDPRTDNDIKGYVAAYFKTQPPGWQTWHAERIGNQMGAAERDAAQKAAAHANTPATAHLDVLGRTFLTIADNGPAPAQPGKHLLFATRVRLDIKGHQREVIDAKDRVVMRYDYDLLGARIHQASMEAGERWILSDATGNPLRAWDSRGFHRRMTYDELRRPVGLFATENGVERLAERTEYGEGVGEAGNHRTRVHRVFDGAGIATSEAYDFKGNLLSHKRELLPTYKQAVNWLLNPAANDGAFTSNKSYDALNRPLSVTTPDGSVYRPTFNEANMLNRVSVELRGAATATPFVTNIDYNAKGQRELIAYGNSAQTTYKYDPLTFRLTNLKTTRPAGLNGLASQLFADPAVIQDLRYTYDPEGNITRIEDAALKGVVHDQQQVDPIWEYRYDAVYRLIEAKGREQIGQTDFDINPPNGNRRDFPFFGIRANPNDLQAMRNYTERYEYDEVGNFDVVRHILFGGGGWNRSYEYQADSLLEPGTHKSNRLTKTAVGNGAAFPETYAYTDADGNDVHGCMTSINSMKMVWDFEDQLQQVDLGGGGTAYYVYDAAGRRVRKVIERQNGTRQQERIYFGEFELYREYNGGAQVKLERETLHVMDDKRRIALVETKTKDNGQPVIAPAPLPRYQIGNHLGSVSVELDEGGGLISYEEAYPYGATAFQAGRSAAEVSLKRYRYTGKERDEETGFGYHGARYYAPWLGRWISCDPSGIDDGLDLYVYVSNRPIDHLDPDGRANTPIHEDLTRLVALQYVATHTARRVGKAANVPDTEEEYESVDASMSGDPKNINRDIHVLGGGTRQEKIDATMARYARRDLRFVGGDEIRDAGIHLLHPIQDASYHGASFGRGMGHSLTPESDLAVGDKSFAEFYQVVKDTEKGLELMQQKGALDKSQPVERLSKERWVRIYKGLKAIENSYGFALATMNFLGVAGRLAGPVAGLVGGLLGAGIGAIGGFFAALFSGKNVAKQAANWAENGFVRGQAYLGAGVGTVAGLLMPLMKNQLRNEVAAKQSEYLREEIYTVEEEKRARAATPRPDRLDAEVRP